MITSRSNPQVKRLLQLQKKRKARDEENVFVVEGHVHRSAEGTRGKSVCFRELL